MRRPIIAGNWKMNTTLPEAKSLARDVVAKVNRFRDRDVILFVPYPFLLPVVGICEDSHVMVGAQDISEHTFGAYTGEVCASMVKSVGATWTIVGHSERRSYHLETDEIVNNKVKQGLDKGLKVMLCFGEKLAERERGTTFDVVQRQVTKALSGVSKQQLENIALAYEPVWAIGTGKTATPAQAQEVHEFVRGLIGRLYDDEAAANIRILYGGSVKPNNCDALLSQRDIDGALVGGASLNADSFARIVNFSIEEE